MPDGGGCDGGFPRIEELLAKLATPRERHDLHPKERTGRRPEMMIRLGGLERAHRGAEALVSRVPAFVEPDGRARRTPTTDGPLEMQTKSTIHTDSLVPGVFAEPVRAHDTVDAHRRTATVAGTTEPEPLAEVLAERARRALEEAWAADWGWPWMTAIWRAAAAEWRAARGQTQRRPADSARLASVRFEDRRSKKE